MRDVKQVLTLSAIYAYIDTTHGRTIPSLPLTFCGITEASVFCSPFQTLHFVSMKPPTLPCTSHCAA